MLCIVILYTLTFTNYTLTHCLCYICVLMCIYVCKYDICLTMHVPLLFAAGIVKPPAIMNWTSKKKFTYQHVHYLV